MPYVPTINGHKQKTAMFGDQGFYERGIIRGINSMGWEWHIYVQPQAELHWVQVWVGLWQYLFSSGHNVSFSRSGEKDLVEKLDGLVSVPQEWHKKKVDNL